MADEDDYGDEGSNEEYGDGGDDYGRWVGETNGHARTELGHHHRHGHGHDQLL